MKSAGFSVSSAAIALAVNRCNLTLAADYAPKDFVLRIDPAAAAREHRRSKWKRRLLGQASTLTVCR